MTELPARKGPSRRQIAGTRPERWRFDNEEAIESSNAFVKANGVPLAHLRLF